MAKEEEKKEIKKKVEKKTVTSRGKKTDTKKSESSNIKKSTTSNAKTTLKKSTSVSKKSDVTQKGTSTNNTKKASSKRTSKANLNEVTAKPMLAEYYDLPYRYNQTIVKILAQTPTTLFVYWDISDEDRNSLMLIHGENFFNDTRPILVVHNLTHNYSFEIEINDFANSWYIRTQEPNCNYSIELGRKYNNFQNEYIYINSSNNMTSPNDHILFENIDLGNVLFKNTKTNILSFKDFGNLKFLSSINKLYGNIYDVYNALYNDEIFSEHTNPSSGEFCLRN